MTELFPILIASKGRAGRSATMRQLATSMLLATLFVEPQDAAAYAAAYPGADLTILSADDQGLPFVRQQILQYARERALSWFWMLDDDITEFSVIRRERAWPVPARTALAGAQRIFADLPGVAQAGLEYQQFAWSARRAAVLNSYCDVAVCVNVAATRTIDFRPATDLKCDRDYTMQCLANGWRTVKVCAYAFDAPANGSNVGGLHDAYATAGREAQSSRVMEQLWPGICVFYVKPGGRPDVKINWRALCPPGDRALAG